VTPPAANVKIRPFVLGPFETNSYLVEAGGHAWLVDPSFGPEALLAAARDSRCQIDAILLTHAHVDHIAGLGAAQAAFPGAPILIHEAEAQWPGDPMLNMSDLMGAPISAPSPDRLLRDGDELALGPTRWKALHTPGHSPGGVVFYSAQSGVAISGDALFAGSIGRTDFPGGNFETLASAIRSRLYTLPNEVVIHPGHGPSTTIGREKRTNPFVRPESR
jgi:glyoxylase-like metal-dependent hydrolase (beta-lactamase superfamily II)